MYLPFKNFLAKNLPTSDVILSRWRSLYIALRPMVKRLLVVGLVATLTFGPAGSALAARSGGRIGGGSFRRSTPTYSGGGRSYSGSGYRSGGYGGGVGFPFLVPFFGFGGGFGTLFALMIGFALINYISNTLRGVANDDGAPMMTQRSPRGSRSLVSVAQVQVGLLAQARSLQTDLDRMATTADTGTAAGRSQVLQEATLSLLRHPDCWVYGNAESEQVSLEAAEVGFNRLSLEERSKFTQETLSNYNSTQSQRSLSALNGESVEENSDSLLTTGTTNEYIVVTLLVAAERRLDFSSPITGETELRQALSSLGAIAPDDLVAVEILWSPQANGDVLSKDDILTHYPDLRLV
ncbi:MAG: DUF1517 domain-containing protein [Cyanobacteria bacterium P01_D01_bin.73]